MEIELNNTVNKTQIEINYFIRDKHTMKTVKHNNSNVSVGSRMSCYRFLIDYSVRAQ